MKFAIMRIIHLTIYTICFFIPVFVFTLQIPLAEKFIHAFAWCYISIAYAYFCDKNPPRFLQIENLYGVASQEKDKEYLDELLGLSHSALSLMRQIQLHQDYDVVNKSIEELKGKYNQLKKLSPPHYYKQRHHEILFDIKEFLTGLDEGNYYLPYQNSKIEVEQI